MSLNIAKLSEVLDEAAPGRKLAAAIKSQNDIMQTRPCHEEGFLHCGRRDKLQDC